MLPVMQLALDRHRGCPPAYLRTYLLCVLPSTCLCVLPSFQLLTNQMPGAQEVIGAKQRASTLSTSQSAEPPLGYSHLSEDSHLPGEPLMDSQASSLQPHEYMDGDGDVSSYHCGLLLGPEIDGGSISTTLSPEHSARGSVGFAPAESPRSSRDGGLTMRRQLEADAKALRQHGAMNSKIAKWTALRMNGDVPVLAGQSRVEFLTSLDRMGVQRKRQGRRNQRLYDVRTG